MLNNFDNVNHCSNVPIVLVGTKHDLRADERVVSYLRSQEKEIITFEQGKMLMKDIGARAYIECSSKTGLNVKKVFEICISIIMKDRREKEPKPTSWCVLL